MLYRRRLRSRIILSFLLFGTLLSGLFAISTLLLQRTLEDELIGSTLKQELDDYLVQLRQDPTRLEPFHTRIQGFITRPGDPNQSVTAKIRNLDTGVHEVETTEGYFKAAVRKDEDLWAFLIYDISENQRLTNRLVWSLVTAVIVFSMLSLALGLWSSRRVMKPVTDLAERLSQLGEETPSPGLARWFPDDEVGQLAAALDAYAERVHHLVERDREFNADVSHELRTPLAVISGATELLLAQQNLPEKTRLRILRIARAARQSSDITTALLHLVRAEQGVNQDSDAQDVCKIVDKLIHLHEPLLDNKPLELRIVSEDKVSVIAPESVIAVAVGNLISNAIRYTPSGEVVCTIGSGRVLVEDTGTGIPEEELSQVMKRHYRGEGVSGTGSGLGLAIVKRLCELYGWSIRFENRESGGLRAELSFFG
ncbi:MAG: HAMP domain-containing histidine kinase [Xanthomonadales bacterium]|nr:HAMP domain-containing histidine kinase [Gammaproteobacteria bacterium]MBT8074562.1 HAMP domain-containing histidine kinase [Gammaproteobacteria bacterium]MBT8076281.1 HAMP domain-containing histidine kinase [Gammaproteobacteria bacterium]NNK05415.1 HAMP domain-containing histidine kinase [Xanthomonadales bacterium]NNK97765.1 HAMP domain-containing histidine kinase [Xanthomonadales bacterium]